MAEEIATIEVQETIEEVNLDILDPIEHYTINIQEVQGEKGDKGDKGDPGPPGAGTPVLEAENVDVATIHAGMAVATDPTGAGIVRASCIDTDRRAIGVALTTAPVGSILSIVVLGPCEIDSWTAATGGAWLPPNSMLWLSSNGTLSVSPPTSSGQFQQLIGYTIEPQKIIVNPSRITILA